MRVLIVAGSFRVDPARRDEFLAGRAEAMALSRAEPGCIDYVFSADPLDAGRAVLYERWEDEASLAAHLQAIRDRTTAFSSDDVPVLESEVVRYDISSATPLG